MSNNGQSHSEHSIAVLSDGISLTGLASEVTNSALILMESGYVIGSSGACVGTANVKR